MKYKKEEEIYDMVKETVKENTVRVVYFKIGKKPEVGTMANSVDGMQEAVGGYVQVVNIGSDGMVILCDEEGLMKELPYNRGLKGDWLVVGTKGEEFVSLTDSQVEWVMQNVIGVNAGFRE